MSAGPAAPAVTAVIRAYKPTFKSTTDKLAFALHAIVSVAGCRLVAVGAQAETGAGGDVQARQQHEEEQEEASLDGWDASSSPNQGGVCAFRYVLPSPSSAVQPPASRGQLLIKAVVVGQDQLLASFLMDPCPEGQAPDVMELDVLRYCGHAGSTEGTQVAGYTYSHLEELIGKVQAALRHQAPSVWAGVRASQQQRSAPFTTAARDGSKWQEEQPEGQQRDPLREYSQPSGRGGRPGGFEGSHPLQVGGADVAPGGIIMPARFDPLGGALGGMGLDPGGGMLMGPEHPAFSGRGGLPPGGAGGRSGPGPLGQRWDPIAPQGLPGWRPGDFQRPPPDGGRGPGGVPDVDPDIMQPGAGRGTDWDAMYG